MFEITSFLLKHLYEMMADNYNYHHHTGATVAPASETIEVSSACVATAANHHHHNHHHQNHHHHHQHHIKRQSVSPNKRRQRIKRRGGGKRNQQAYDYNEDNSLNINNQNRAEPGTDVNDLETANHDSIANSQSFDLILRQSREQETNQQIISFLTNNQLPDLACDTFIELLFICVFLAFSWIFVMIIQLHFNQFTDLNTQQQPAKNFYCNTPLLASLMYCYNKGTNQLAY